MGCESPADVKVVDLKWWFPIGISFSKGLFSGAILHAKSGPSTLTGSKSLGDVGFLQFFRVSLMVIGVYNHLRNERYLGSITILSFGDWIPREGLCTPLGCTRKLVKG